MTIFDPSHPQITQDTRPTIVDAPLRHIFRMWQGAYVYTFRLLRRPIHFKWSVTYIWHYFTVNSSISECDHKCETRNAQPEMGTDGSSHSRQNPQVDRYGSGFGQPRVSGSGCCTGLEPNRPVFAVQTETAGGLPGPVATSMHGCGWHDCLFMATVRWAWLFSPQRCRLWTTVSLDTGGESSP
jgi:hypothetical protein